MTNSRDKGKRGELEFSRLCKAHGYDARRGQQFCGLNGDADVIGLPGIHVEVKRVEKLNIYDAMRQAVADARPGETPIVAHRRNNHRWLITMDADDWFLLLTDKEGKA